MKKRRTQTATQKAYQKEVKRIKQFVRRAEKRGYQFTSDILPKKPKRITKASVRKLQKIKPENLYKKSIYAGEATYGEIVSGEAGRKAERKAQAQKGAETRKQKKYHEKRQRYKPNFDTGMFDRVAITNWFARLNMFQNGEGYTLLRSWMNQLLVSKETHDIVVMLQEGEQAGNLLTYEVVYKIPNAIDYISDMIDYIPDEGVFYKDEMLDKIEYMSRFSDAMEDEESWDLPI